MIDTQNWTYCCYQQDMLVAQIQYGAIPSSAAQDSSTAYQEIYSVLVMDHEFKPIFILDFKELELACHYLNTHYQHWNFKDLEAQSIDKNASGSGCSSCQAH